MGTDLRARGVDASRTGWRGRGEDLLLTPHGLGIASDTTPLARETHEGLGLFPVS